VEEEKKFLFEEQNDEFSLPVFRGAAPALRGNIFPLNINQIKFQGV